MSIIFGYNPVVISYQFVLAATLYFSSMGVSCHSRAHSPFPAAHSSLALTLPCTCRCPQLIQNHAYSWGDWKLMWFAHLSNTGERIMTGWVGGDWAFQFVGFPATRA
jgi:hypothetical protein